MEYLIGFLIGFAVVWSWREILPRKKKSSQPDEPKFYALTQISEEDLPPAIRAQLPGLYAEIRKDFEAVVIEEYDDWAWEIDGSSTARIAPDGTRLPLIGRTVKKLRADGKAFLIGEFHEPGKGPAPLVPTTPPPERETGDL